MAIRKSTEFDRLTQEARRQVLMHDNPLWVSDHNGNETTLGHAVNDIQNLIHVSHDFGINPLSVLARQFPAFEWKYRSLRHDAIQRFLTIASSVDYVWSALEGGDFTTIVTARQVARAEPRRLCICPLCIRVNSLGNAIQTVTNIWHFPGSENEEILERHDIRLLSFNPYTNDKVQIE